MIFHSIYIKEKSIIFSRIHCLCALHICHLFFIIFLFVLTVIFVVL